MVTVSKMEIAQEKLYIYFLSCIIDVNDKVHPDFFGEFGLEKCK